MDLVAIAVATCSYAPINLSLNAKTIHNTHGSYVAITSTLAAVIVVKLFAVYRVLSWMH